LRCFRYSHCSFTFSFLVWFFFFFFFFHFFFFVADLSFGAFVRSVWWFYNSFFYWFCLIRYVCTFSRLDPWFSPTTHRWFHVFFALRSRFTDFVRSFTILRWFCSFTFIWFVFFFLRCLRSFSTSYIFVLLRFVDYVVVFDSVPDFVRLLNFFFFLRCSLPYIFVWFLHFLPPSLHLHVILFDSYIRCCIVVTFVVLICCCCCVVRSLFVTIVCSTFCRSFSDFRFVLRCSGFVLRFCVFKFLPFLRYVLSTSRCSYPLFIRFCIHSPTIFFLFALLLRLVSVRSLLHSYRWAVRLRSVLRFYVRPVCCSSHHCYVVFWFFCTLYVVYLERSPHSGLLFRWFHVLFVPVPFVARSSFVLILMMFVVTFVVLVAFCLRSFFLLNGVRSFPLLVQILVCVVPILFHLVCLLRCSILYRSRSRFFCSTLWSLCSHLPRCPFCCLLFVFALFCLFDP